jgi:hypothetical protein
VATFLTTPSMDPALRARIERAVSPRARARHNARGLGIARPFAGGQQKLRLARLFPLLVAAALGALGVASYRAERSAVAAERSALLDALADRRARLPAGHDGFVAATDRWITEAAREPDRADLVTPTVKGHASLEGWLHRPAVYVHLGAAAASGNARALDDAAQASSKDAFLLCLLQPPAGTTERELLAKVRGVYFGGAKVDDETTNVRRLAEAHAGLAAVGPAFESALHGADELPLLRKLRRDLEAAPLTEAARAASSELFVIVVDEGPEARVVLVDLTSKSVLLRVRRRLEVPGTSPAASIYREQLEGCALAMAVRRAAED